MIEGVLYQASVELIAETPEDKAHLHAEMRALAKIYHLDLRYAVRESPPGYPKHIAIWDANRPVSFRDLIIATNALYGGFGAEKPPGGVHNASEST